MQPQLFPLFPQNGAVPVYPVCTLSEEKLILEIAKKELEPWRRVPAASYPLIAHRERGPYRYLRCPRDQRKFKEKRQAAMERLEVIKTVKGPMFRSQLVAEVCEALLASGSLKGYTFSSAADAPAASAASCSSGDPQRRPEPGYLS